MGDAAAAKDIYDGHEDDFEVEQEAAVMQIPGVEFYFAFDISKEIEMIV